MAYFPLLIVAFVILTAVTLFKNEIKKFLK